jgi:hypothetical protein
MSRGAVAVLAVAFCGAIAGNAAAAIPQQIYRDLADNGRLDRKYSRADINRALRNPSIPGYARPERVGRTPQSHYVPSGRPPTAGDAPALPFTGLDLALFGAVGGPLLLLGGSMRRVVRARATEG